MSASLHLGLVPLDRHEQHQGRRSLQSWGPHLRSSTPGSQSQGRRRQVRLRAIEILPYPQETASGSGGGGGAPPEPPSNGVVTDEWEGDGQGEGAEAQGVEELLAAGKTSADQLPADLQEALSRGRLSAQDARNWLRVCGMPLLGRLAQVCPPLRDRLMGNPRFLLTLVVELVTGCTAKLIAEVRSRREAFWREYKFVASDLALEVCCDLTTVWLLSPRARLKPPPSHGLGRVLAGLPAHAFQMGSFTPAQRLGTVALSGIQFGLLGTAASAVGHAATIKLVERDQQKAEEELQHASGRRRKELKVAAAGGDVHLAPVWKNSLGWGSFSAGSVQLRYQLVNALEERLFTSVLKSSQLRGATSFALRFANSIVGGTLWIDYARFLKLQ